MPKPSKQSGTAVFDYLLIVNNDYNGGTVPVYVGQAFPGTVNSIPGWRIQFLTYDVNNNVTSVRWSPAAEEFGDIWNNRASLVYS